MAKVRLDTELVNQGFFKTADEAARFVLAGEVSTSDRRLEHPGEQVEPGIELHVRGAESRNPYVSRGGLKLGAAFTEFDLDANGKRCLDVGCSTGGFTDCLLRHGAAHVVAVDVGYAQFDWSLRGDERIELLERTNIRELAVPEREGSVELAVCDVSFTSVIPLLDSIVHMLSEDGEFVVLVKPQFECRRDQVGEGGIVRDPAAHEDAISRVIAACEEHGLGVLALCPSPITGHKGNREYLLHTRRNRESREVDITRACYTSE